TSQYHGFRLGLTDHPERLREIFVVWSKFLSAHPEIRCIVKFHPFDSRADQTLVREIFKGLENVSFAELDSDIEDLLDEAEVHSTVSSGSIISAMNRGVPNLIFGTTLLVDDNIPASDIHFFENESDLDRLLDGDLRSESEALWLNEEWMRSQMSEIMRKIRDQSFIPQVACH
ncbi:MAG: hypothetical protein ACQKBU_02125, partial [Verrucomicrobiales bacterium]